MTISEFKAWFDGYTLGGGKDVEVIKAKLAEVFEFTIHPYEPNPYLIPTPTIQPWNPWTIPYIPHTAPYIWCGAGTSSCDPHIEAIVYNA